MRGRAAIARPLFAAMLGGLVGLSAIPAAAASDCRANFGGAYNAPHGGRKPNGNPFTAQSQFVFDRGGTFTVTARIDEANFGVFEPSASSGWWWVGPCDIAIDRAAFVGHVSPDGRFINLATFDDEQLAGTAVRGAGDAEARRLQGAAGSPLGPQNAFAQTEFGRLFAGFLAQQFADRARALRAGASGFAVAPGRFDMAGGGVPAALAAAGAAQMAALDPTGADSAVQSPLGGFIAGGLTFGRRSFTPRESDRRFTAGGITLGADYRLDPAAVIGLAGSYFTGAAALSGGTTSARGAAVSLYGTSEAGPAYVDGFIGGGIADYDASRSFTMGGFTARMAGSPGAHFVALGGNAGYRLATPTAWGRLSWGPLAELRGNDVAIDGYHETGTPSLTARVRGRDAGSVQTGLGGELSFDVASELGLLRPHLRATWRHEFADAVETAAANFVAAPSLPFTITSSRLGRDFAAIGVGITGTLRPGIMLSADYLGELGRSRDSVHQLALSARIAF